MNCDMSQVHNLHTLLLYYSLTCTQSDTEPGVFGATLNSITSAKEVMISVEFVCLLVCYSMKFSMKFLDNVGMGTKNR